MNSLKLDRVSLSNPFYEMLRRKREEIGFSSHQTDRIYCEEGGVIWFGGSSFTPFKEAAKIAFKDEDLSSFIVLVVVDEKRWVITKLKYGI
jgi:hypothetical protein